MDKLSNKDTHNLAKKFLQILKNISLTKEAEAKKEALEEQKDMKKQFLIEKT